MVNEIVSCVLKTIRNLSWNKIEMGMASREMELDCHTMEQMAGSFVAWQCSYRWTGDWDWLGTWRRKWLSRLHPLILVGAVMGFFSTFILLTFHRPLWLKSPKKCKNKWLVSGMREWPFVENVPPVWPVCAFDCVPGLGVGTPTPRPASTSSSTGGAAAGQGGGAGPPHNETKETPPHMPPPAPPNSVAPRTALGYPYYRRL